MFAKRCPRADELEALATEGRASVKIKRHVEACETCARIVTDLAKEAELVDTVREAVRDYDEKTCARVAEICHELANTQRRRPGHK